MLTLPLLLYFYYRSLLKPEKLTLIQKKAFKDYIVTLCSAYLTNFRKMDLKLETHPICYQKSDSETVILTIQVGKSPDEAFTIGIYMLLEDKSIKYYNQLKIQSEVLSQKMEIDYQQIHSYEKKTLWTAYISKIQEYMQLQTEVNKKNDFSPKFEKIRISKPLEFRDSKPIKPLSYPLPLLSPLFTRLITFLT